MADFMLTFVYFASAENCFRLRNRNPNRQVTKTRARYATDDDGGGGDDDDATDDGDDGGGDDDDDATDDGDK